MTNPSHVLYVHCTSAKASVRLFRLASACVPAGIQLNGLRPARYRPTIHLPEARWPVKVVNGGNLASCAGWRAKPNMWRRCHRPDRYEANLD